MKLRTIYIAGPTTISKGKTLYHNLEFFIQHPLYKYKQEMLPKINYVTLKKNTVKKIRYFLSIITNHIITMQNTNNIIPNHQIPYP